MQGIKEREREREKDPNTNTRICFEDRATALRPRLQTEGFPLCPHRTFHEGTSIEELQLNTGSIQLLSQTQAPLHKREGTKPKQRKGLHLGDLIITNSLLAISKDHKQFSHENKDPKDRIECWPKGPSL